MSDLNNLFNNNSNIEYFKESKNTYMNSGLNESIKKIYKIEETFNWKEKCKNWPELPSFLPKVPRIIVIGDLHGDWDKMIKIYKKTGIIDRDYSAENYKNNLKWTGGNTVVVQLGDQIDSCRISGMGQSCKFESSTKNDKSNDIDILNFNTDLHNEAQKDTGAIYSLMGNHELMNVDGNFDYVSHQNVKKYSKKHGSIDSEDYDESRKERIDNFKPGNKMANFLACTRQVILKIGSNLFVHAGIVPSIVKKLKSEGIKIINNSMRYYLLKLLNENDRKNLDDIFNNKESPLWSREYKNKVLDIDDNRKKENCDKLMEPITHFWKVGRIFVGHTPQIDTGIRKVCDDRIVFADYGSSKAFDPWRSGKQSDIQYIEILNDEKVIIHKN